MIGEESVQVPARVDPRRRLQRAAEAHARRAPRGVRRLGRVGGGRPHPGVRGDPRVPPGAGVRDPLRAGRADEDVDDAGPARRVVPELGGTPRARPGRPPGRRQPAPPGRRDASARRSVRRRAAGRGGRGAGGPGGARPGGRGARVGDRPGDGARRRDRRAGRARSSACGCTTRRRARTRRHAPAGRRGRGRRSSRPPAITWG